MPTSFFKTLLRNLWLNPMYTALNILRLALGITCAALIFLWVEDKVHYDDVHVKKERLYTVLKNTLYEGTVCTLSSTPGLFGLP